LGDFSFLNFSYLIQEKKRMDGADAFKDTCYEETKSQILPVCAFVLRILKNAFKPTDN